MVFFGRSDAVLNPGGVRIGTAEIYRQVEQLDEVIEGLVIGQDWEGDVRVVLFVVLRPGLELDDALKQLAAMNEQQARMVELYFFGGLNWEQVAEYLEIPITGVCRGGVVK